MLFVYYSFLAIGIISLVLGAVILLKKRDLNDIFMYACFISALLFLGIFISPAWQGMIESDKVPSRFHEDIHELMNN